jgi:hypothetical protein
MLTELQDGKYMRRMTDCLLNLSQDLKKYEQMEVQLHAWLILLLDAL